MYFWGEFEQLLARGDDTSLRPQSQHDVSGQQLHTYWGYKPYDKNIKPVQNLTVSFVVFGEGFHNYHHVFPWDYRTSELGNGPLNLTAKFIDFFAWIGWAYDLKTAPEDLIESRASRTGDGTNLWGWGDEDQSAEEKTNAKILYSDNYGH
ncbi:Acyl-CoA Delta(11) desaturase [Eumeta japonica]|uniref:Acyl-CoA Delta(11) desaturase n=1 Tax=Eumeta variegata TaxID=151549 RepID=A0A4C1V0G5_EUMVA|nr:Acyl-CoA Delta(11) desaturase [Eumeta japonica]